MNVCLHFFIHVLGGKRLNWRYRSYWTHWKYWIQRKKGIYNPFIVQSIYLYVPTCIVEINILYNILCAVYVVQGVKGVKGFKGDKGIKGMMGEMVCIK